MSSTTEAPEWTRERFTSECDWCHTTERCQWSFDGTLAVCLDPVACQRRVARQRKSAEFQPFRLRREVRGEREPLSEHERDERQSRSQHLAYTIEQCRIRRKQYAQGVVVEKQPRQRKGTYSGGHSGYYMPAVSSLKPEILAWWGKLTTAQQAAAKPADLKDAVGGSYEMSRRSLKVLREAQK